MTEPLCLLCNGQSWTEQIIDGEAISYRCLCFKRRLAHSFLGPELAKAPHRRSALYCPELERETGELLGDQTLDDLFIKGVWGEVAQHLRWAVGAKHYDHPAFTFKMVNDEMLLRVWLGDFKYQSRSRHVRDEITTYNSIRDLVGDCSLLIVRLGNLAHNNKAAGNVLLEVLNLRASESKPTWLIEGATPFGDGHKFFNYEVGDFIENNFEKINVGGDIEAARKMEAELQALSAGSLSLGTDDFDQAPTPQTQERYTAEPGVWEQRAKKRAKNKWGKGRGKSGGLEEVEL